MPALSGAQPALTRLIASASRSHAGTYGMKPLSPPVCDCASFGSCGLGIVGSVGIFTRMVCSIAGCLPRQSCKALAFGQLSAIVTWGGDGHATARRTHRGGGERPSISVPQLRLYSRATTFRKSSDQCRDTPRILVALTSDPVAIIPCAWRSASRTCKPQSVCQTINSSDRFFKLRRVATTGVLALPASLAAAVDRRVRHVARA